MTVQTFLVNTSARSMLRIYAHCHVFLHHAFLCQCLRSRLCWVSWVKMMLWPTVSRPISLGVGHPFGAHDEILLFPFFCRKIALLFVLEHPLWREDGSVICSAICQWLESRRTRNHTLLRHLRLLGSVSVASYDSQGLRCKYSYPPPHGDFMTRGRVCNL
jgi:hypothetical protein